jgi:hypothetical protein
MKKTIQTEQGQRLKLLRSQVLKLTQKRFSEIIETSSKSVTRYESGMSSIPDIVFTTIGYYYKEVNISWLKNGVGDIQQQAGWTDPQTFKVYLKSLGLFNNNGLKEKSPKLPG